MTTENTTYNVGDVVFVKWGQAWGGYRRAQYSGLTPAGLALVFPELDVALHFSRAPYVCPVDHILGPAPTFQAGDVVFLDGVFKASFGRYERDGGTFIHLTDLGESVPVAAVRLTATPAPAPAGAPPKGEAVKTPSNTFSPGDVVLVAGYWTGHRRARFERLDELGRAIVRLEALDAHRRPKDDPQRFNRFEHFCRVDQIIGPVPTFEPGQPVAVRQKDTIVTGRFDSYERNGEAIVRFEGNDKTAWRRVPLADLLAIPGGGEEKPSAPKWVGARRRLNAIIAQALDAAERGERTARHDAEILAALDDYATALRSGE